MTLLGQPRRRIGTTRPLNANLIGISVLGTPAILAVEKKTASQGRHVFRVEREVGDPPVTDPPLSGLYSSRKNVHTGNDN